MTLDWIARRELHPDAPTLGALVDDVSTFGATAPSVAGNVGLRQFEGSAPWCDAERLWDQFLTTGVRAPGFRLVRGGTTLPRPAYCRRAPIGNQQVDDVVEPNHVLEHYAGGATVVLQALQFRDPELARLSVNLGLALDQPVQVNAYLTPPGEQGLDIHFDFHDVIVVHLAGSKRWRVWAPLPRTARPVKQGPTVAQPTLTELGAPVLDRVVEPGDCLAVPRGFPHCAESLDVESAHLTIGIMALTWNRVLRDRIDEIASGTALADRVPFGRLDDDVAMSTADAIEELQHGLDPVDLRHAIATEVWRRQPRTRLRRRGPIELDAAEAVVVTPGPLLWLDQRPVPDGKHTLHMGDRRLRFPPDCTAFVAAVLGEQEPFSAKSLDPPGGLDLATRLVVLSRLATEGVVAPSTTESSGA